MARPPRACWPIVIGSELAVVDFQLFLRIAAQGPDSFPDNLGRGKGGDLRTFGAWESIGEGQGRGVSRWCVVRKCAYARVRR
jgi:hypothetical protein